MATPKKTVKKTAKKQSDDSAKQDRPAHVIDAHVAQSAAAALVARAKGGSTPKATSEQSESAAFKKLKQGVSHTQHSSTSPLSGGNKFNPTGQSGGFNRQVGHAQNSGANFNRVGVPRRTSGG